MLQVIKDYIAEVGGYEEWKKRCLAEEQKWLRNLRERYDALPLNKSAILDVDMMSKEAILEILREDLDQYEIFFQTRQIYSLLEFHQKMVTFIQLYLLDEIESETEPTVDIITRALENYVELKKKEEK